MTSKDEIWKKIKGFEHTKYLISNFGNIKNTKTNYILETNNKTGYSTVLITHQNISVTHKVHILVAESFLENDNPNNVVNHKDGNKLNNNVSNLEWTSQSNNTIHAYKNNLYKIKPKIDNSKDYENFINVESKKIPDYPNYSATIDGRIFSHNTNKFMTQNKNEEGYVRLSLKNKDGEKKFLVHRLIAVTFISNPNKYPQVNHIDSNKENNYVNNLEWTTNQKNRLHALKNYKVLNIVTFPMNLRQIQKNIIKAKVEINFLNKTLKEELVEVKNIYKSICKI